ncbi:MAG: hypothetical protein R3E52_15250 [Burkholderiaceae bacterium]
MTPFSALLVTLALAGGSSLAQAQVNVHDGALVGPNGMTLYTFDKDMAGSGKSACTGSCATNWPPLTAAMAPSGAGYGLIERDDGAKQVTYKGKPLYYWSKDSKPGDRGGNGKIDLWHTAMP